jgi:hypothetical protein
MHVRTRLPLVLREEARVPMMFLETIPLFLILRLNFDDTVIEVVDAVNMTDDNDLSRYL